MHRQALLIMSDAAVAAESEPERAAALFRAALHYEAHACHSLTDLFATGHLIVDRWDTSKRIYLGKEPKRLRVQREELAFEPPAEADGGDSGAPSALAGCSETSVATSGKKKVTGAAAATAELGGSEGLLLFPAKDFTKSDVAAGKKPSFVGWQDLMWSTTSPSHQHMFDRNAYDPAGFDSISQPLPPLEAVPAPLSNEVFVKGSLPAAAICK